MVSFFLSAFFAVTFCRSYGMIPVVDPEKCTGCGECVENCPPQAIEIVSGTAEIDKSLCEECGECAKTCPEKAITIPRK